MNRKVTLRCTLISLLLALPAPLLIVIFLSFTEGALTRQLLTLLEVEGLTTSYLSVVAAVFLLLLAATFTLQAFSPRLTALAEAENDDREIGEVKWFNVNKGYGFIKRESGEDIFVHFRAIRGRGHRTLAEGQKVRYYVIESDRGLQADDVTIIT